MITSLPWFKTKRGDPTFLFLFQLILLAPSRIRISKFSVLEICEKIGKILSDCFCVGFTNHGKNDHEKVDNNDKFFVIIQKKKFLNTKACLLRWLFVFFASLNFLFWLYKLMNYSLKIEHKLTTNTLRGDHLLPSCLSR